VPKNSLDRIEKARREDDIQRKDFVRRDRKEKRERVKKKSLLKRSGNYTGKGWMPLTGGRKGWG